MTLDYAQQVIAQKYHLGTKLVTGHKKAYFDEATQLYLLHYRYRMHGVIEDKITIQQIYLKLVEYGVENHI